MIEIENLSFAYNKQETVIDNISLKVAKGSIYGFLGPNGSGKTTIIRLMLNLLKHNNGEITIDGQQIDHNSVEIFRKIGSMIESPSLYNHLSGRDNLEIFALYYNIGKERIDQVLEIVGLTDAAGKLVKRYSLGMKQRLGIAICLLHDPELLILDEPLNGLDPQGIAEIRNLFLRLNREEGKTILISSHLLSEIENTCTHIGIINKGKLLFEGKIDALKNNFAESLSYLLECTDPTKATILLREFQISCEPTSSGSIILQFTAKDEIPVVLRKLVEAGLDIYNFQRQENNLEELFLEITK